MVLERIRPGSKLGVRVGATVGESDVLLDGRSIVRRLDGFSIEAHVDGEPTRIYLEGIPGEVNFSGVLVSQRLWDEFEAWRRSR